MIVNLFQFSKRNNSTKLPQSGSGVEFSNIVLKEPTDFLNPVIRFTASGLGGTTVAPIIYNYAHIPKFARYYFVNDWNYVGGCWECSLSVDALGSWKASVGTTTAYIERAESAYNGNIIDGMFPATTDYDIEYSALSSPWNGLAPSGGSYVVGVVNTTASTRVGAVTYYALSQSQLSGLITYLYGNSIFTASNITEIGEGLWKSIFNPMQYIVSCMWLPFNQYSLGRTTATITLGYWSTNQSGVLVDLLEGITHITGTLPNHPQASTRGSYLNYSPFSYYTIYIPPFGAISMDSSYRSVGRYLRCPVTHDNITGQATLRIGVSATENGQPYWANEVSGMLGVPIQLSQVMSDYSSLLSGATGLLTGGGLGGLLSGAVQSAVESFKPSVNASGTNGSFNMVNTSPGVISAFTRITSSSNSIKGRPLMDERTINTLSGYIKCSNVKFSAPCLSGEKDLIESYMNEGFYYE